MTPLYFKLMKFAIEKLKSQRQISDFLVFCKECMECLVEATEQNFRLLFLTETTKNYDNEINKLSLSIIVHYFIITMKSCNDFIKI